MPDFRKPVVDNELERRTQVDMKQRAERPDRYDIGIDLAELCPLPRLQAHDHAKSATSLIAMEIRASIDPDLQCRMTTNPPAAVFDF